MDDHQKKMAEELLFSEKKNLTFAKALYFGKFDEASVFPFPQVDEQEKKRSDQFLQDLEALVEKELDPVSIDKNAEIPDSLIKSFGDIGLLGMTIPKEYGGLGLSQYAYCRAIEVVARKCGSTALFINAHQSIGLKALLLFGTDEQKKRWLVPLAKGEALAAFSLTEPNAGSDASSVESEAVYDSENKSYILNGKKQWTTNGSVAKILTVMAQTEVDTPQGKQKKITAFLVTPDMPGFNVTAKALEKVGMRGSKTANLEFKNVVIPESNILGKKGSGLKICLTVLDYGRTTFGATCTGAAKFLLQKAVEHSQNRIQFKKPLASFGLVKEKIARMSALVYAMDASTYLTAGLVDSGNEDFMLESAILKVFTSDSLWSILYDTMQIYGGRSFFTDAPFERMMRDARLNMIGEGSNEVMRVFIGVVGLREVGVLVKDVIDKLNEPFKHFLDLKMFLKNLLKQMRAPTIPVKSQAIKKEADMLSKAIRRFGFSVLKLLKKYRENVIDQQMALDKIAISAIALYTTTAVLSKIDSEISNQTVEHKNLESAKLYCHMAMNQLNQALDTLFDNEDEFIEKVSDEITGYKK